MRESPILIKANLGLPGCVKLFGECGEACKERARLRPEHLLLLWHLPQESLDAATTQFVDCV